MQLLQYLHKNQLRFQTFHSAHIKFQCTALYNKGTASEKNGIIMREKFQNRGSRDNMPLSVLKVVVGVHSRDILSRWCSSRANISSRYQLFGNKWQNGNVLATFWQLLATFGNFWQLLTTIGNHWQLLATFANF